MYLLAQLLSAVLFRPLVSAALREKGSLLLSCSFSIFISLEYAFSLRPYTLGGSGKQNQGATEKCKPSKKSVRREHRPASTGFSLWRLSSALLSTLSQHYPPSSPTRARLFIVWLITLLRLHLGSHLLRPSVLLSPASHLLVGFSSLFGLFFPLFPLLLLLLPP